MRVVKLVSFVLLFVLVCLLLRGVCDGVGVDVVTGNAGKSRRTVKLALGLGLFCCVCLITLGHSLDEA